jgi:hypothetical protein
MADIFVRINLLMSVLLKLASSQNDRSEIPNKELADEIVAKKDRKGIKELVENLHNKNKAIQNDCIKTLYEIGERDASLIADHVKNFIALLDSKVNRLQWGAMSALDTITEYKADEIYKSITKIVETSDKGTVITKDNCVRILVKLAANKKYASDAFELLLEQIQSSPTNQLPMYAEMALSVVNEENKAALTRILSSRFDDIEKETKRKRVEKVISKLTVKKK